jgi:hypothetical protein
MAIRSVAFASRGATSRTHGGWIFLCVRRLSPGRKGRIFAAVPPSTSWKEVVAPDEEQRFTRYAEQLHALQREHGKERVTDRALHAKGQAGVEAQFTVLGDLPEHARHGLFAAPAAYRAYVRFSNGTGGRQPDKKGDVRGVAIKVLGAPGKKIIPGMEDAKTQDFLLIRTAVTPFKNAAEFVGAITAVGGSPLLALPRIVGSLGLGRALKVLGELPKGLNIPMTSFATTRYFSAAPIKLGPYAVHYAITPRAPVDTSALPGRSNDYLGEELSARLAKDVVSYDFGVQFFVDEEKTPIEDASVEWKESDSPYVTVATLTLTKQEPTSPRGKKIADHIEHLAFDPWHAMEDHRPLGDVMRARNYAYRVSTKERHAAAEPDGSETFD